MSDPKVTREDREAALMCGVVEDVPFEKAFNLDRMHPDFRAWLERGELPVLSSPAFSIVITDANIARGIAKARAAEREAVIAYARAQNYGPTLRTFAKHIARGYHTDGHRDGEDGGRA